MRAGPRSRGNSQGNGKETGSRQWLLGTVPAHALPGSAPAPWFDNPMDIPLAQLGLRPFSLCKSYLDNLALKSSVGMGRSSPKFAKGIRASSLPLVMDALSPPGPL